MKISNFPQSWLSKTNKKLQRHGLNGMTYKNKQWTSNQSNISPQELWNLITFKLEELIEKVAVTTWNGERHTVLEIRNKSDMTVSKIRLRVQRSRSDGQCYTIHFNKELTNLQVQQIQLNW